jgi:biotin carboxyl carrier protein
MKLAGRADGKPVSVEVDLARGTVRIGGQLFPVQVRQSQGSRVELEIAGELVQVEGWPSDTANPTDPVAVNGEMHDLELELVDPGVHSAAVASAGVAPEPSSTRRPGTSTAAIDVTPPMPGRVIELRVREAEHVTTGAVLLVLEAMKMRNEVLSPVSGVVSELRVGSGQNVRAREVLARITPD